MKNTQFDPSIHFYALEKGSDTMGNSSDDCKTAEDAYRAIRTNFSNKRSNEIIEALENLINSYPKFAAAYNDLGVLYYNAGHKENAHQFYQTAVQLDPNNPVFSKNLADFYCIELGRIEEALQIYVNILRSHPDDTETLMATGQICVALERPSDALVFFNRILEIEPWNDDVRKAIEKLNERPAVGKAKSQSPEEIYQNIKRKLSTFSTDEAIEHFQKLVELYPEFALGHNDLGVLHYNEGHKENALKHYRLAAQLQPENITFRKNLADFLFVEMGKVEEALKIYEDILNMHPQDVETLLITGHICVSLKRFEEATVFYNRVLELEPDNSDAKNNIHALNIQKRESKLLASELHTNDSITQDEVEPNDSEGHFDAIQKPQSAATIIVDLEGVHNRVKECIKSLQAHTFESHEVILVNRGASKGIHKWAQELVKNNDHYQIIECNSQTVWAESVNQAIQKAHGEMIILIHNDIVVPKGWLRAFRTCFNLIPDIGLVGPMTNETSGIQQMIFPDESERVLFESAAEAFYQENQYRRVSTSKLSDFCLAFHRKLLEKIGYLDDQFASRQIAVEEFCSRVARAGYQNLIAADTYVYHYNRHKAKKSAPLATKLGIEDRKKLKAKLNRSEGRNHHHNHSQTAHILAHAKTLNAKGDLNQAIEILLGGIGIIPDDDQLYLSLAEILVAAKRFQDAKDTLAEMPSVDNVQHIRKAELLGYAEEGLGNFEAALTQVERVLTAKPNAATALNLKGMLAFRNRDPKSAEQFFREALASDPGYGEPYTNLGILKLAEEKAEAALKLFEKGFILTPFDFDIATNYHSLIGQLDDYQRAESLSREASALYPYNQKIKYLLIDCLVQLGKYDEAMAEIEAAIVKFGVEDGILSAALKIRQRLDDSKMQEKSDHLAVSLCMIVKNEEKYLAQCLASVKPIVDEMIVVDTGSSDKTKDIARAFGAKVYDHEWRDDFAEARNFSIRKANGHWIFIMDADEVISPQDYNQFLKIVGKEPKTAVAYSFNTRNYNRLANMIGWTPNDGRYPDEEAVSGWLPSSKVRLFSGKDQIRFEGAVHEMVDPVIKRNGIKVKQCHIPIHHYGRLNKDDVNRKDEVYFEIGKKKLEDMGDDINAIRELAIQATNMEKNAEALKLWEKLLSLNLNPRSVSETYINMGTIHNRMGTFQYALEAAKKAVE
ncbi:MAG: tetratricopeptide repeat protein, partial [Desulfobacterales bacterium]